MFFHTKNLKLEYIQVFRHARVKETRCISVPVILGMVLDETARAGRTGWARNRNLKDSEDSGKELSGRRLSKGGD
jgi:hypothetical protein